MSWDLIHVERELNSIYSAGDILLCASVYLAWSTETSTFPNVMLYMADNHFCDELSKQEIVGKTTAGFA